MKTCAYLIHIRSGAAHARILLQRVRHRLATKVAREVDAACGAFASAQIFNFYIQFGAFLPQAPRVQVIQITVTNYIIKLYICAISTDLPADPVLYAIIGKMLTMKVINRYQRYSLHI